jgi:hypothetical protein
MKKWVPALTVIAILVLTLYYWARVEILSRFTNEYPAQLTNFGTIYNPNPERKWKIMQMQPMIVGYATYDERNYLKIIYPDGGKISRAMVLLNGKITETNQDKFIYAKTSGEIESINFEDFKDTTSIGQRVRLDYLGGYPFDWEDESKEFCTLVSPVCEYPKVDEQSEEILNKAWLFRPQRLFFAMSLYESLAPNDAESEQ